VALFAEDPERIVPKGRRAGSALRVHRALEARPLASMQEVCRRSGLSFPAATTAMKLLLELGIARELTGKRRGRVFAYDRYMAILNEGTEA
jgi:predicted transcriptional regulator